MDCTTFNRVIEKLHTEHEPSFRRTDPWEEIVMTVLSQNTSDENRDLAYERLVEKYETPSELLEADREEIEGLIRPAGLAKSKSEYIQNAARYIAEERDGDTDWIIENDSENVHDELTSIKGIGHKTADVVLLFAAEANICPVDTHVDRLTHRLGVAPDSSTRMTRRKLIEMRDECGVDLRKTHISLISHGRATCTARSPNCSECVVEDVCEKIGVED